MQADGFVRDWLVISPVDVAGRRPFRCDAVFAKHVLDRKAAPPKEGDKLTGELAKEVAWENRSAKEKGQVEGEVAWAYASVESATARVAIAELEGASTLFVNGTPFAGDAYSYGFRGVPVALREGKNDVYVGGIRGAFSLKLREASAPLVLADWDATFPDARKGDGAVLVLNASERPVELESPVARKLLPLEAAKVQLAFDVGSDELGKHPLKIEVSGKDASASSTFQIEIRKPAEAARRTFVSSIDGSVQPYAVLPPAQAKASSLVLTLHGAGVDALGQARSYSPKDDFWIVAPTNRRPYGFDWQDWGRLDAYEALAQGIALSRVGADRLFLTGHSMGGHGTWHLAANDPECFAAIAPSAGWISFDTYGKRPAGALADLWQHADGASRTLDLVSNLAWTPIYILHGSADDNVPVTEARAMEQALAASPREKGHEVTLFVKEGAGHWWDGDASPGADCVDWPPIFELFRRTVRTHRDDMDWISIDPSVSSRNRWAEVAQPIEYGKPFRVVGAPGFTSRNQDFRKVSITTKNVRRLHLDLTRMNARAELRFDGMHVEPSNSGWYFRGEQVWIPDSGPGGREKTARKSGPFKLAFEHNFVLVYGTSGDEAENRELLELARWTSESWWYRGNGSTTILADTEFLARGNTLAARNVILFGNADTNAAWKIVVPATCPIQAQRGALRLGEKRHEGKGLAALFVYPRADGSALVGAFADTGAAGTRLLTTVPVFVSGVGIPDYALFGPDILTQGDGGVLAAGWFDHSWRL